MPTITRADLIALFRWTAGSSLLILLALVLLTI